MASAALSNRLKFLRQEIGISQKECAKKLGVDPSKYNKWENGKSNPDYDSLIMIAEFYSCSIDYLLGVDEYRNKAEIVDTRDELNEHAQLFGDLFETYRKKFLRLDSLILICHLIAQGVSDDEEEVRLFDILHDFICRLLALYCARYGTYLPDYIENCETEKGKAISVIATSFELKHDIDPLVKAIIGLIDTEEAKLQYEIDYHHYTNYILPPALGDNEKLKVLENRFYALLESKDNAKTATKEDKEHDSTHQ